MYMQPSLRRDLCALIVVIALLLVACGNEDSASSNGGPQLSREEIRGTVEAEFRATAEARSVASSPSENLEATPAAVTATDVAQDGPMPAGTTSNRRFTSAEHGFSFEVPPGWKVDPEVGAQESIGVSLETVGLSSEDGEAYMMVALKQLNETIEDRELPVVRHEWERVIQQLATQMDGEVVEEGTAQVGSLKGFQCRISYPSEGKTVISRQVDVFSGDRQYNFILESDEGDQEKYNPALDHVMNTFELSR
jgi:hypothetical protein